MRADFEVWAKENLRCDLSHNGEYYNHADAYYAWKGWVASRQALVVELPPEKDGYAQAFICYEVNEVTDALDKAGVSYR